MRTSDDGVPIINKADEFDRLMAFMAANPDLHHRLPFLRAAKAQKLAMCEIQRGGMPDWKMIKQLSDKRPFVLLIGDDDHQSTGPTGFPGMQRLRYWIPRKVIVHATSGDEAISQDIVDAAQVLRRIVLVETSTAQAKAWGAWGNALNPHYRVFTLHAKDGVHPKPIPREKMQ